MAGPGRGLEASQRFARLCVPPTTGKVDAGGRVAGPRGPHSYTPPPKKDSQSHDMPCPATAGGQR